MEAQAIIATIMERHGARCRPEEFHDAVNVLFHEFESECYNDLHRDMWESLPRLFELLVADYLNRYPDDPPEINLLDIGCGTGLATDCLLQTALGRRIKSIDLLDTSPAMLRLASKRISWRNIPVACHQGIVESLPQEKRYHCIVTCSVLHHVPDLPAFLCAVRKIQSGGGVFLHLQDPNGDFLRDPELQQRMARFSSRIPESLQRFTPGRILGRLRRQLAGTQGQDYISKTNRALLEKGVVATPLSVAELFAITDIHADLGDGEGISIARMKSWLPDYECISQRSYAFWGKLSSTLPPNLKSLENDLIARGAPNGFHIGAAWKLRAVNDRS